MRFTLLILTVFCKLLFAADPVWIMVDHNTVLDDFSQIRPCNAFRVLNIWGINPVSAKKTADSVKPLIEKLHEQSSEVSGMLGMIAFSSDQYSPEFIQSCAVRDPLGKVKPCADKYYHACLSGEIWKDELFSLTEILMDAGCDLIELDQPALEYWRGECYCDRCMENFRLYLKQKFSPDKLKDYFSISDIDHFNYRKHLSDISIPVLGKTLAELNEGDRFSMTSLGQEFFSFQISDNLISIRSIVDRAKKAAAARNRKVRIFGNIWGMAAEYIPPASEFDLLNVAGDLITPWNWSPPDEMTGPPENSWVPVYRLAKAFDPQKNITGFLDTSGYIRGLKIFRNRSALLQISALEAAACGADYVFPAANRVAPEMSEAFSAEDILSVIPFYRECRSIFSAGKSLAEIAVFLNFTSIKSDRFSRDYWGLCYLLSDSQIHYETVFSGDGELLSDSLTLEMIEKYRLIFIPQTDVLTPHQEKIFWNYLNKGGKLIISGGKTFNHSNCARVNSLFFSYLTDKDGKIESRVMLAMATLLPDMKIKFDRSCRGLRFFSVSLPEENSIYLLLINADYQDSVSSLKLLSPFSIRLKQLQSPEAVSYKTAGGDSGKIEFLHRYDELEFKTPQISDSVLIRIFYGN